MATYTDNYNLEKPAQSDLYNVDVFNDNSDIIDAALASKALAQNQATIESTSSASRNYAKGEFLVYNGLLYKVTAAISSGGTIAPGTNCSATNTGTELKALNDSLTDGLATITSLLFFGGYGKHYRTAKTSIDSAVNDTVSPTNDVDGCFTIDNFSQVASYGNHQFIFGWINAQKTYGWCFVCSFSRISCGRRSGSTTFTLTVLGG